MVRYVNHVDSGQERTSKRDPLRLPGRESFAAFTDVRLVSFAQLNDEFVHPGSLSRSDDRLRVRLGFETRDILRQTWMQRAMKR